MDVRLPCIVLLAVAVYSTIALKTFNSRQMESLSQKLFDLGVVKPNVMVPAYEPCKQEYEIFDCYEYMHDKYAFTYEKEIVTIIKQQIDSKRIRFNDFVWSYMMHIEKDVHDLLKTTDEIISSIAFPDSQLYCVAEFINMMKIDGISGNDLLDDYFFYYQFATLPNLKTQSTFINYIKTKLQKTSPRIIASIGGFKNALQTSKNNINIFSKPFCELQGELKLKWKDGAQWLWTNLNDSNVVPKIIMDGKNLYDYKGLDEENLTLGEALKDNIEEPAGYIVTTTNYTIINNILNNFVLKVLLRKIIYVVTKAMELYYNDMKNIDFENQNNKKIIKDRQFAQSYLFQHFSSFQASNGLYFIRNRETIEVNDYNFLTSTLREIYVQFRNHTLSTTVDDPKLTIENLNKRLTYKGLALIEDGEQNHIDHYRKINEINDVNDLVKEIEKINFSMLYIVELVRYGDL